MKQKFNDVICDGDVTSSQNGGIDGAAPLSRSWRPDLETGYCGWEYLWFSSVPI